MKKFFESKYWAYTKGFAFVFLIILLVVYVLTGCSPIVNAQRGITDSVWRVNKSTVYNVRVKVDSCTTAITKWNVHCYCENYTIPQLWDVAILKNGKAFVKPVK